MLLLVCVLYAGQTDSNIETIAATPLNDLQLSAALDQQIKSPNRVFSTPTCYAAVSVGFPDCVNIVDYLLDTFTAVHICYVLLHVLECVCLYLAEFYVNIWMLLSVLMVL